MKITLFISVLMTTFYSICFGENNEFQTDTIRTENGILIIKRLLNTDKQKINKVRSSLEVTIRDKESKNIIPLSFIGINKALFQVGEKGMAYLYLKKGKYKISASYIGYKTFSARIIIDLNYDYKMEILISSDTKALY